MADADTPIPPRRLTEINPAWLTDALRHGCTLQGERVTSVTCETNPRWNVAETGHLHLVCDPPRPDVSRLFAKLRPTPDPFEEHLPGEYWFYTETASPGLPAPACHFASRDAETGRHIILIDDLSTSHRVVPWPETPDSDAFEMAAATLGRLHAATWRPVGDRNEGEIDASRRHLAAIEDHVTGRLPTFLSALSDEVSPPERALIETAMAGWAKRMGDRIRTGPTCAVHGDPHIWNFQFPRDRKTNACLLIDWEDWRLEFPGTDLAMLLCVMLDTAKRRHVFDNALVAYRAALEQGGINDFGESPILEDIRLGHLCSVIVPVFHQESSEEEHWRKVIRNWLDTAHDLDCAELLT